MKVYACGLGAYQCGECLQVMYTDNNKTDDEVLTQCVNEKCSQYNKRCIFPTTELEEK